MANSGLQRAATPKDQAFFRSLLVSHFAIVSLTEARTTAKVRVCMGGDSDGQHILRGRMSSILQAIYQRNTCKVTSIVPGIL